MVDEQTPSDRNIVEMLRDDQASGSKKNWKSFRDKLRLKRTGKAWISSVPIPASDIPIQSKTSRMMTRRGSWRYPTDADANADVGESDGEATLQLGHMPERQRSVRLLPLETDPEDEDGNNPPGGEQKQAAGEGDQHMSLMTLLSSDGSNYIDDEEEHVEEHHEEDDDEDDDAGDCQICCGCKAKFKGTALGPCGHTFCKHCTKELHVAKGNCTTCNNFILEILDLF